MDSDSLADAVPSLTDDLEAATAGQAEALDEARQLAVSDDFLVHRRSLPVFTTRSTASLPPWAAGLRVDRSLGPFRDRFGRDTWIDVFRRVRGVRLLRSTAGTPFLTLPIELLGPIGRRRGSRTYDVAAGSIWLASKLLATAAPAGSYTGLRITGGTLRFSQPVVIDADEIVVPANVTVELDMQLDVAPPVDGGGPGGDARMAAVDVPRQVQLAVGSSDATIESSDTARLLAFGSDTDLQLTGDPATYFPDTNRLAVPCKASSSTFTVRRVESDLFAPAGAAEIEGAAWGLPVAVIDPASLGDAAGVGALMLWLGPGLQASWLGQPQGAELGATVVAVDDTRLSLVALQAHGERVEQSAALVGSRERVALRMNASFPLSFVSQAIGTEAVITEGSLSAVLDKPIDARGERLPLQATTIPIALTAVATGRFLDIYGALDPLARRERVSFALINAVLVASYPRTFSLYGAYDGAELASETITLEYGLFGIVPTLPDPYAASYPSLRSLVAGRSGRLLSISSWDDLDRTFDFVLLDGVEPSDFDGPAEVNPFAVLEEPGRMLVSKSVDQWPAAIKAAGAALTFESRHGLILLDLSTNVDQFGVGVRAKARVPVEVAIERLSLQIDGGHLVLLTLPAVQWEAVETLADPDPTFPSRLSFANSGVPSLIGVPTVNLVPLNPAAALKRIVDNFAGPAPQATEARFTLPFGIIANAELREPDAKQPRGALVSLNRPSRDALKGARQLRIDAVDVSLPADKSPSLPGYAAQLPVGQPGSRSVLGNSVTSIFNSYLGAAGARPLVPLTRFDLSGYGESVFSDWRNPYDDPAIDAVAVEQARFDVLIGRTAYEVIQVRSYLLPYGVKVVRTITIQRRNNAVVTRHDSGWKAVSDGTYRYPSTDIRTHSGVVRRITDVGHIRETAQVQQIDGIDLAAVYFDGNLELDGAPGLVAAKDQFGFVPITSGLFGPLSYARLIATAGALGGPIDARINVGGGPQVVRVQRVDVGVTSAFGTPEFVMTAWGALAFPGGGEWTVLQVDDPTIAPQAVARERGLPLIRAGYADEAPSPFNHYRFADPADLARPDDPDRDYGIVHATGTQRVFFPNPRIDAADPTRITSTRAPALADPYTLATALGLFPELSKTIPFPSRDWALRVSPDGNYRLDLPANTFPAGVGRRTTRQAGSVKSDLDYTAAEVTYELDTAAPVPWRFRLDRCARVMNSTDLGDVIRVQSNIVSHAGSPTVFEQPKLQMGGSLSVVQDLLTILADLGITGTMRADMTNEWSLAVAVKVPFLDASGDALQIPPLVPLPDIKFEDTGVEVELKVRPALEEAEFQIGGQPMFAIKAIPGLYVVAIIEFSIKLSTEDGTTYTLLIGVGFAYSVEAGPFELKGLMAVTFFGFIGDGTMGFGVGFLVKVSLELSPIFSIELSLEGKLAVIRACIGTGDETVFTAAKLVFTAEISICLVFSISFELETTVSDAIQGPGEPACALPGVI